MDIRTLGHARWRAVGSEKKVSGSVSASDAGRTGATQATLHVEELRLELPAQLLALLLQTMFVASVEIDVFGRNAELERTAATVAVGTVVVVSRRRLVRPLQHLLQRKSAQRKPGRIGLGERDTATAAVVVDDVDIVVVTAVVVVVAVASVGFSDATSG